MISGAVLRVGFFGLVAVLSGVFGRGFQKFFPKKKPTPDEGLALLNNNYEYKVTNERLTNEVISWSLSQNL
ncbi:hypothetical protein [Succinimonas amylolytica]|uniref:hypothetical protein n=1 Tax=Succinimonas amylolytica TaxID=83769 RepID=UPI0023A86216